MIKELAYISVPGIIYTLILYLTNNINPTTAYISVVAFFALGVYKAQNKLKDRVKEMEAITNMIKKMLDDTDANLDEIKRKCGKDIEKYEEMIPQYPRE